MVRFDRLYTPHLDRTHQTGNTRRRRQAVYATSLRETPAKYDLTLVDKSRVPPPGRARWSMKLISWTSEDRESLCRHSVQIEAR